MRVFCLGTGRCGSTTFAVSMGYASNFTSGHETRTSLLGPGRLEYPDQHVEADNRLSWFLGGLERRYGDAPVYVHLVREREAVIRSYRNRRTSPLHIIPAFGHGILMTAQPYSDQGWDQVAGMYVDTVTDNIEAFLQDKSKVVRMRAEQPLSGVHQVWDLAGMEGDLVGACRAWQHRYNTGVLG